MQIILLTHSREVSKKTNTGQLIEQLIPETLKIIWQRTEPDANLLKIIKSGKTALLYPSQEAQTSAPIADFENFILIDSTWQEARKIVNRSPYLQPLPRVQLSLSANSKYTLRRNQLDGGLCTAECAIELLKQTKNVKLAETLDLNFTQFISAKNNAREPFSH